MATEQNEDLYETLGLPRGGDSITQNEIKRAYHKCALKYHPDRLKEGQDAQEQVSMR